MAAASVAAPIAVTQRSFQSLVQLFAKEAKYEVLKNTRIPVYAISTVVFPLMFYVLFGIVLLILFTSFPRAAPSDGENNARNRASDPYGGRTLRRGPGGPPSVR